MKLCVVIHLYVFCSFSMAYKGENTRKFYASGFVAVYCPGVGSSYHLLHNTEVVYRQGSGEEFFKKHDVTCKKGFSWRGRENYGHLSGECKECQRGKMNDRHARLDCDGKHWREDRNTYWFGGNGNYGDCQPLSCDASSESELVEDDDVEPAAQSTAVYGSSPLRCKKPGALLDVTGVTTINCVPNEGEGVHWVLPQEGSYPTCEVPSCPEIRDYNFADAKDLPKVTYEGNVLVDIPGYVGVGTNAIFTCPWSGLEVTAQARDSDYAKATCTLTDKIKRTTAWIFDDPSNALEDGEFPSCRKLQCQLFKVTHGYISWRRRNTTVERKGEATDVADYGDFIQVFCENDETKGLRRKVYNYPGYHLIDMGECTQAKSGSSEEASFRWTAKRVITKNELTGYEVVNSDEIDEDPPEERPMATKFYDYTPKCVHDCVRREVRQSVNNYVLIDAALGDMYDEAADWAITNIEHMMASGRFLAQTKDQKAKLGNCHFWTYNADIDRRLDCLEMLELAEDDSADLISTFIDEVEPRSRKTGSEMHFTLWDKLKEMNKWLSNDQRNPEAYATVTILAEDVPAAEWENIGAEFSEICYRFDGKIFIAPIETEGSFGIRNTTALHNWRTHIKNYNDVFMRHELPIRHGCEGPGCRPFGISTITTYIMPHLQ